jgi:branched-chain amino acid transport system permease protein
MKVLEVRDVRKRFGGLVAVDGISFVASSGSIKSIIGPNGAGKTTLFNIISGLLAPDSGSIVFFDRDITSLPPFKRARLGIGRTFQKSLLFETMSVLDNVRVIVESASRASDGSQRPFAHVPDRELAAEALRRVGLYEVRNRPASLLGPGEKHLLEIARALALRPTLLLLDEPAAGLNDAETERLASILRSLRDEGICLLLVEHNMKFVMEISDEVFAMNEGRKLAEGPPLIIQEDDAVIEAYLGGSLHNA